MIASAANEYSQTTINADLNSTAVPDHLALTWSADPTQTMTVSWRTNTSVRSCKIEYKSKNGQANTDQVSPRLFETSEKDPQRGRMNLYTVTLEHLKPGSTYAYRVGNDKGEWTDYHAFTTESPETLTTNRFQFLVFGDSQSGNMNVPDYNPWHATVQNAFKANPNAKFFINMGDLVEKGQYYQHWNNWFNAARGVIDRIPDMVVQGNHETYDGVDWHSTKPKYFLSQFHVFEDGPKGLKGQTYSYNYGKVHFVVLDSQAAEESEDAQGRGSAARAEAMFKEEANWLRKDLEQNKGAEFTFVFFHKTPYYTKGMRSNPLIKQILCPIFEEFHVDVVFNGHDHSLSRTYPIHNDEFMQSPTEGTVYYITGRSGAKYYPDLTPKVWDAKFHDPQDEPCYETVDLDGSRVAIRAFKQDGTSLDTYVIDKAHPEADTSLHELLPTRYNTAKDQPDIGRSVKLVVFGNFAYGRYSKAKIQNGKAYADIQTIATYVEGHYDPATKTLTVPLSSHKKFQLTDAMLADKGTKVSIDALNDLGWANHYDKKFNMVFVDLPLQD